VGLERGKLSLVSTTEELLEKKKERLYIYDFTNVLFETETP
jgi:hypothetical protein